MFNNKFTVWLDDLYVNFVALFLRSKRRRMWRRRNYMRRCMPKYNQTKREWAQRGDAPLIPGRFAEYDLAFTIGATCMMTFYLAWHNMRSFSNPFDWTDGLPPAEWQNTPDMWRDTRFREKIDALCDNFANYFNPDDLKPVSAWIAHNPDMMFVNVKTKIRFPHVFLIKSSMETQLDECVTKIQRRAERLINAIDTSNKILICWGHRMGDQLSFLDAPVSDADIKYAVDKLRERWPDKEFDIVFFEHDGTKAAFEYDKIHVYGGAYRIRSNHFIYAKEYGAKHQYPIHSTYRQPHLVIAEALDNIRVSAGADASGHGVKIGG